MFVIGCTLIKYNKIKKMKYVELNENLNNQDIIYQNMNSVEEKPI